MNRFKDKNILITGGTSGIGLAAAKRLAREGARVLVTGTHPERISAANEIEGVRAIANDAAAPDSADVLASEAKKELGPLHGVFLNAGLGRFQPFHEVDAAEFDSQFAINVRAPLLQLGSLSGALQDGAAVVINTSVARSIGMEGASVYASTKGALRTMTRVLARELAPRQIRVNAVSPGPIDTNFFARTGMNAAQIQEFAGPVLANAPLGRFGTPDEVAAVALFLLSADASYVTGSEYVVDGGFTEM